MLGVNRREHVFLADELVDVLLGLGIEARIVIRIPRVGRSSARSGRRAHDRFVDAADTARTGVEAPDIIATLRIGVTPADEAGATNFLRRENRIEAEQPVAAGRLEIRIGRQRLDLGAADQVVTGVVTNLEVLDLAGLRTLLLVLGVAVIEAQIVVVGGDRAEHVVPDDLDGDVGIVGVDQRERLTGDKADDRALVLREPDLRGVLFSRILIRRRPVDALGRHDLHRHPVLDLVVDARADQVFDLGGIFGRDEIARFDLSITRSAERARLRAAPRLLRSSWPGTTNSSAFAYPDLPE